MNKRKTYFRVQDPILQRDILIYLGTFWGIWFLLQSAFIYVVLCTDLLEMEGRIGRAELTIFGSIFFSVALFLAAILLFNRFLHRIIGPIHRIKVDLDSFIAGSSRGPTQIRQGDYFQELADSINQAFLRAQENIVQNQDRE